MDSCFDDLNIACIIPARGGSKGIPHKNIRMLANKPMIAWSIEDALASRFLGRDRIYVSSDDAEILSISEKYGAIGIKRPDELAQDQSPTEPALKHAVQEIEKRTKKNLDLVVFLQCTSPVRKKNDIDRAIQEMLRKEADSLLSVLPIKDYFVWNTSASGTESKNFDYKHRKRRQDLETMYLENGSIYVFKREVLMEYNNRLGGKIAVFPMSKISSFQIDEPEDFEICEAILSSRVKV